MAADATARPDDLSGHLESRPSVFLGPRPKWWQGSTMLSPEKRASWQNIHRTRSNWRREWPMRDRRIRNITILFFSWKRARIYQISLLPDDGCPAYNGSCAPDWGWETHSNKLSGSRWDDASQSKNKRLPASYQNIVKNRTRSTWRGHFSSATFRSNVFVCFFLRCRASRVRHGECTMMTINSWICLVSIWKREPHLVAGASQVAVAQRERGDNRVISISQHKRRRRCEKKTRRGVV